MPALPPVDAVAKVSFIQQCSGITFRDRIFVLNGIAIPWSETDMITLCEGIATAFHTFIAPHQDAPVVLEGVEGMDLSSPSGVVFTATPSTAGTNVGTEMLPLNCAVRTTFISPRRYRGGRPGINLTGLDKSAMIDERTIATATVTAINGAWTNLLTSAIPTIVLSTGSPTAVLVSYFTEHAVRPIPLVTNFITMETQARICTLRKRLGRGESG